MKFQAEHIYQLINGRRVHYQVAGPPQAPALILLHGIGGSVNWWRENLAAFSRYFRTYALDMPGFGQSWRLTGPVTIEKLAEFVHQWLLSLGRERVYLLGHSMGGQVAIRLAAQYPAQIERLVLAAPSGLWPSLSERIRWVGKMPRVSVPLNQSLTIAVGTMRTDMLALGLSLRAIVSDRQTGDNLQKLTAPTLLLWGTADGVVPPALGPAARSMLTNTPARLEFIERGTHNMMFDQASRFNRLVIEFLQENNDF